MCCHLKYYFVINVFRSKRVTWTNLGLFAFLKGNKFQLPPWSLLTIGIMKWSWEIFLTQFAPVLLGPYITKIYPLSTSCCTLNRAGWCHLDLPLRIFTWLPLIRSASVTCLVRQLLVLAVTLALLSASFPWCAVFWCFTMIEVINSIT